MAFEPTELLRIVGVVADDLECATRRDNIDIDPDAAEASRIVEVQRAIMAEACAGLEGDDGQPLGLMEAHRWMVEHHDEARLRTMEDALVEMERACELLRVTADELMALAEARAIARVQALHAAQSTTEASRLAHELLFDLG